MRNLLKKLYQFIITVPCPDCNGKGVKMRERGAHAYCFKLCCLCRGKGRV